MQNLLVVQVLQGQQQLNKKTQDLLLGEGLPALLDQLEQTPVVRVLHDHVQHPVLDEGAIVPDDVGVGQAGEDLGERRGTKVRKGQSSGRSMAGASSSRDSP